MNWLIETQYNTLKERLIEDCLDGYEQKGMKKKFLNNKEKQALKQKRADMIVESFNDTYNKIKRLNESEEVDETTEEPQMDEKVQVGHQDDEAKMLKKELIRASKMVHMLYDKLDDYDKMEAKADFPQWWQKKIILANSLLDDAFDYLDGEEKYSN